jgi:hypothetical protein
VSVARACNPSNLGGRDQEDCGSVQFEVSPRQIVCKTLSQKITNTKWAVKMTQVVELLPSKYEALSLSSNTIKK